METRSKLRVRSMRSHLFPHKTHNANLATLFSQCGQCLLAQAKHRAQTRIASQLSESKPSRPAMEGQEGSQELHLVLAHKLFLLRHPDVQDIEKVRLKEEVFAVVKADGESPILTEFFRVRPPISSHKTVLLLLFLFVWCRYGCVI